MGFNNKDVLVKDTINYDDMVRDINERFDKIIAEYEYPKDRYKSVRLRAKALLNEILKNGVS